MEGAATWLCQASEIWRDLEMPYEEGHTCLLMARVCERRGDHEGQRLDVEHQRVFRFEESDRAVALVAFRHEIFAARVPMRVRAQQRNFRANIVRRMQPAFAEKPPGTLPPMSGQWPVFCNQQKSSPW